MRLPLYSPFVLLLLLLGACVTMERPPVTAPDTGEIAPPNTVGMVPPVTTGKTPPPIAEKKGDAQQQEEERRQRKTRRKIARRLDQGDYPAVLKLIKRELARGTAEKELAGAYQKAINGAIEQGDVQLARNQPDRAGLLFRTALDNYPDGTDLSSSILLPRQELEARLETCAEQLMSNGLVAYRAGNLDDAITEWKKIIAFQPQHLACSNAIKTAEQQRATLQKLDSGN